MLFIFGAVGVGVLFSQRLGFRVVINEEDAEVSFHEPFNTSAWDPCQHGLVEMFPMEHSHVKSFRLSSSDQHNTQRTNN